MTYERALFSSAEREKFSVSTLFLERKIMSTKTTIKRISAIAALALAFGGLTSVASQAANPNLFAIVATSGYATGSIAQGFTGGAAPTQIAGPANFVTILNNGSNSEYYTITGGATTSGATTGTVAAAGSFSVATPAAGTITVTGYVITGGAASATASDSITISVVTALSGTLYSSSSVLAAKASYGGAPDSTSDAVFPITVPAASVGAVANFTVTEKDAGGTPLSSGFKSVAVQTTYGTISGVTGGSNTVGSSSSYVTTTPTGVLGFSLNADGRAGESTVTVSVNGVAVKSYKVIFSGTAAKIVLTVINPVVAKGTAGALYSASKSITANIDAIQVQEFDAAGNAVALNTLTLSLVSSDATVATADAVATLDTTGTISLGGNQVSGNTVGGKAPSTTLGGYSIAGVAAGTAKFTAKDSTGTLVSNEVSVRVSSGVPTKVEFTTDASEYAIVSPVKLTATVSDAAGVVPAGTYTVFDSNGIIIPGSLSPLYNGLGTNGGPITDIKVDNTGTVTTVTNAPFSDGTFSISATGATGVTVTPAAYNATSGGATAANAASDAAAEATDAANAATDAANAAADSADQATAAAQDAGDKADAALAAVMALSQQVTDLLDKINALADENAQLGETLAAQSDALAAQTAALAAQAKTVAAQTKALAAQKALVARLVRKAKA